MLGSAVPTGLAVHEARTFDHEGTVVRATRYRRCRTVASPTLPSSTTPHPYRPLKETCSNIASIPTKHTLLKGTCRNILYYMFLILQKNGFIGQVCEQQSDSWQSSVPTKDRISELHCTYACRGNIHIQCVFKYSSPIIML
jgi:hypothetical protein